MHSKLQRPPGPFSSCLICTASTWALLLLNSFPLAGVVHPLASRALHVIFQSTCMAADKKPIPGSGPGNSASVPQPQLHVVSQLALLTLVGEELG
jgi:hypothetical protein